MTLEQDLELLAAQRDAMADAVARLLGLLKQLGGYRTAEQQELVRWATSRLAEQGRRVCREDV